MDSSARHNLQNTSLQKHADVVLPFTLDALDRDTTATGRNPAAIPVDIDYSTDNSTTWIRIATQAQDTGWYLWNVPCYDDGEGANTASMTPTVTDTSDAVFTIVLL